MEACSVETDLSVSFCLSKFSLPLSTQFLTCALLIFFAFGEIIFRREREHRPFT